MRVAILTISDSAARGARRDESGPAVRARCEARGWQVVAAQLLPDEAGMIEARLIELADAVRADLILTTGGTGLGPRDVTPEATLAACSRQVPGLAERMRAVGSQTSPRAVLSRAVAGVRHQTLIVNLPGSPRGAVEAFDAIADLLPHAVEILRGARHD
jgi:molybdenum cofactor synthesis domain-containing protein